MMYSVLTLDYETLNKFALIHIHIIAVLYVFVLFPFMITGELSSHYAGRAHVPLSAGLNETLQLWMSCRATRTLIDITTQCLSCLMHSDTESCINALLGKSLATEDSCQLLKHFDYGKFLEIFYLK